VISPPWSDTGVYQMEFQLRDDLGEWNMIHKFPVHVVKPANRRFTDTAGNSMIMWLGNDGFFNRPFIVVEGFDPKNNNDLESYYHIGEELITPLINLGIDVIMFNYAQGGKSIADNAQYVKNAVNYINSIKEGIKPIFLAGLSMGGVVCRYALAEAEDNGTPLNVSHFISIDSPQQGAVIDSDFQDWMNDHDGGDPSPAINSTAAKQMLYYNTYDISHNMHDDFYNVLNSLNNDGYPHLCKNIGVSFSPNIENPNSGKWLEIDIPGDNPTFSISSGDLWKEAGSFLPISTTKMWGYIWWALFETWELIRHNNPTFIPYRSALDIIDGESKFDVTISSATHNYHDVLPMDIINPLLNEVIDCSVMLANMKENVNMVGSALGIDGIDPFIYSGSTKSGLMVILGG